MSPHTAHTIVSGGLYACHARYPFTASNHTEHSRQEASIHTDARQFTDRTRWVYPPQRRDQTKPALSATRDGSNREPRRRTQAILFVPLPYPPPIDPPPSLLINPPLCRLRLYIRPLQLCTHQCGRQLRIYDPVDTRPSIAPNQNTTDPIRSRRLLYTLIPGIS